MPRLVQTLLVVGAIVAAGAVYSWAQVASSGAGRLIPYEGTLYDGTAPADGQYELQFFICTSTPCSGANAIWTEEHTQDTYGAGTAIHVVAGKFSVELGSISSFSATLFDNNELYLAMSVRKLGESMWTALSGSQRLLAVPYAIRGAADSDFRVSGRLDVGTGTQVGTNPTNTTLKMNAGAIVPTVGSASGTGIEFPNNPGVGSGDSAYIRYSVVSGEDTLLAIGTANDPNDRIGFFQQGAEQMTMRSGNVGIGQTSPTSKLHVGGATRIDGTLTVNGTTTVNGAVTATGATITSTGSPGIVVRSTSGGAPFIGLSNDATTNYDASIVLTGNDTLEIQGAELSAAVYASTLRLNSGFCVAKRRSQNCPTGFSLLQPILYYNPSSYWCNTYASAADPELACKSDGVNNYAVISWCCR